MKRRSMPRWRTVRIHRSYTIDEAARETGACKATVRRWLKNGLASVNEKRPVLILGYNLLEFLRKKPTRQPCLLDECYCLKCRHPRKAALGMVDYVPFTPNRGNLRAICEECGTLMHKCISLTRLVTLRGILDVSVTGQERHLVDGVRRLPMSSRRDITRVSSTMFSSKALDVIDAQMSLGVAGLARAKFRLVEALSRTIANHRAVREASAFERALFPQSGLEFETNSEVELVFTENQYGYNKPYKGGTEFKKHLFRVVGDLESAGEEFDCAVYLERMPQVKSWVRNTSKQPHSFWLQTSSDKFYPDFVALLNGGRYLVVEYKGSHLSTADDARAKLKIGELWADRSGGNCVFVMIENREFARIDNAL